VQRESIAWCQRNITRTHPNIEFFHLDAFHELHNPLASKTTMDFPLPLPDRSVDRITLGSVLTHIFEDEIVHYLREFARVLKPGGRVWATFFLYSEEIVASSRAKSLTPYGLKFQHRYADGCYIDNANYPTGAVAYTDDAMQRMIAKSGLRLLRPYLKGAWSGFYPPEAVEDGQDVAILALP
jgi:SAM-dependent methyltransferase